jgi:hypothetical protein
MTAWSQSEANRTLDEAKRRSLTDPEFRALVLSDPMAALAKINPRQIPAGSVRFIESKDAAPYLADPKVKVVILPDIGTLREDEELTEEDLEQVAGGTNTTPPTPPDPPIGNS